MSQPPKHGSATAIGQINPAGQVETFVVPPKLGKGEAVGNLTLGPDGNLWFPVSNGASAAIGRITAKGKITMYGIPSTEYHISYYDLVNPPNDLISGPGGKLWYESTVAGKQGIARISTRGKLGPFVHIPGAEFVGTGISGLVSLPDDRVGFEAGDGGLDVLTRSGKIVTRDLPATSSWYSDNPSGIASELTLGPDGNLWSTESGTSIVRISGLDTVGRKK